uniref:Cytochrome c oxidase subunit 2 n=1 Tax=Ocnus glacialis TaxID=3074281 RepID=A0AA51YI04_9ECHN|nr:cytochrome c oxidase subunit II [Ocnus glacialis]WMW14035.1 cytochrome c oxidase subunit 2 [Ocnus glacialis]
MEELINFHDYSLAIIFAIAVLVFYALILLVISPFSNRLFLQNNELETIWTIIPAIVLIFMASPSLQLLYLMDEVNNPYLTIKAIGHQWYWSYEYTDYNDIEFEAYMVHTEDLINGQPRLLETDNHMVIPLNNPIRVLVSSTDVLHSWAIPSLGIKIDAIPGRLNQTSLFINQAGLYYGQCSEICGANHSFMPIVIEAVPYNTFNNWISTQDTED